MLTVEGLRLSYRTRPRGVVDALNDVSLTGAPGSVIALLGPSGAGKSTLLKALAGIAAPTAGSIAMGNDVWFHSTRGIDRPASTRRIGMMPQSYALWPHMTVREHLAFPLEHGFGRIEPRGRGQLVEEMACLLGLEALQTRKPGELSGGQQQRLALGRAIINRPRLILLDEPFSNLDPSRRRTIARDIRRLQQHFTLTIIMATHDHHEAALIADSLAVMIDGRIAQQASPEDLYRRPLDRTVAAFMGEINLVPVERIGEGFVHTRLGRFALNPPRADAGGHWLAFRPEALELVDAPAPGMPGQFAADLRDVEVIAGCVQVTLDANGLEFKLHSYDGRLSRVSGRIWCKVKEGEAFLLA